MNFRNGVRVAKREIGNSSVPCPMRSCIAMRAAERHSARPRPASAAAIADGQIRVSSGSIPHLANASETRSGKAVKAAERSGRRSSQGRAAVSVVKGTRRVAGWSREPSGTDR